MTRQVEFFFDFVSPTAYMAWHVLPKIAEKAGAEIKYRPMFLGGVMQATGNRPPATILPKGVWMAFDLPLWAKKWGLPYAFNPNFPVNTLSVMRGACVLLGDPKFIPYGDAMYKAVWAEERNMGDKEEIARVVGGLGIDAEDFIAQIQKPEWKQALKSNTDEAVERGCFGAPSMFVDGNLYFGQDRLFMVAEALGVDIRDIYPEY